MALTDQQKMKSRQYLGFPNIFRYKHTRLESVLIDLDATAEAEVVSLLADIATQDTLVQTAVTSISSSAGVKKADEVEFFAPNQGVLLQIGAAQNRGRSLIGRLSTLLGVPIGADYFGSIGYGGDSFSSGGEMGGGTSDMGGSFNVG